MFHFTVATTTTTCHIQTINDDAMRDLDFDMMMLLIQTYFNLERAKTDTIPLAALKNQTHPAISSELIADDKN